MIVHCPDCKSEISHTAKLCQKCGCTKTWHWRGMAGNAALKSIVGSEAASGSSSRKNYTGLLVAVLIALIVVPIVLAKLF